MLNTANAFEQQFAAIHAVALCMLVMCHGELTQSMR